MAVSAHGIYTLTMWTHSLDPVIFQILGLQVRWYGLMYVISFMMGIYILNRLSQEKFLQMNKQEIDSFSTIVLVGMLLGARLTYVFIYNWDYYQNHLGELLSVWKGGLSFHGGLIGFILVTILWSRKKKIPFYQLGDSLSLCAALGLGLGRIGNFINGELYGRLSETNWGVIFPSGGPYPRHPSQLYEAFFEGFVLFCLLWFLKRKVSYYGVITATFLLGYGIFRYFMEFFREADSQLGYYLNGTTTMGQILCSLMVLGGFLVYLHGRKLHHPILTKT